MKNFLLEDEKVTLFCLNMIATVLALVFVYTVNNIYYSILYVIFWLLVLFLKSLINAKFKWEDLNDSIKKDLDKNNMHILVISLLISTALKALINSTLALKFKAIEVIAFITITSIIFLISIKPIKKLSDKFDGENSLDKMNVISFYSFILSSFVIIVFLVQYWNNYSTNIYIKWLGVSLNFETLFFQIIILTFLANQYLVLVSILNISKEKKLSFKMTIIDIKSNLIIFPIPIIVQLIIILYPIQNRNYNKVKLLLLGIFCFIRLLDNIKNIKNKNNLGDKYLNLRR